jgi:hypothetical protein
MFYSWINPSCPGQEPDRNVVAFPVCVQMLIVVSAYKRGWVQPYEFRNALELRL